MKQYIATMNSYVSGSLYEFVKEATNAPIANKYYTIANQSGYCVFTDKSLSVNFYVKAYYNSSSRPWDTFIRNPPQYSSDTTIAPTTSNEGVSNDGYYYEQECKDCDVIALNNRAAPSARWSVINDGNTEILLGGKNSSEKYGLFIPKSNPSNGFISNSIVSSYISAKKALGNAVADKYIAQPIVIEGVKTPLYSIVSNTASADPDLFTEVAVGGQRFFVVDYGVGVRI